MAKYAAKGAVLAYENPGATWNTVPGVQDFTLSFGETDRIDVTSHDSSGSYREYVNGFKTPADITVPIVWDGANTHHAYILAAHGGSAISVKITGKEASPKTYSFSALVRNIELSWPIDGAQTASVTLTPTGAITVA